MAQKTRKVLVLEFMALNEITRRLDLIEEFGYTTGTAGGILHWLKRQGLIINDRKGEWVVTERGYDRLEKEM